MKTLAGVPYCECESPCRQVADGIEYCGNEDCGNRLVDPALMALAAEVKALRREVADLDAKAEAPVVSPAALQHREAAAYLGMSTDSFERYVQPHVRLIRRGRLRVYAVRELERWLAEHAEAPMVEQVAATNGRAA